MSTHHTPGPMLVGSRQRSKLIQWFWVPAKFFDDHSDRCPSDNGEEVGICKEVRRAGKQVLVECNFQQLDNLIGDATFYADGNVDGCAPLVRSAKATLAAITRSTP